MRKLRRLVVDAQLRHREARVEAEDQLLQGSLGRRTQSQRDVQRQRRGSARIDGNRSAHMLHIRQRRLRRGRSVRRQPVAPLRETCGGTHRQRAENRRADHEERAAGEPQWRPLPVFPRMMRRREGDACRGQTPQRAALRQNAEIDEVRRNVGNGSAVAGQRRQRRPQIRRQARETPSQQPKQPQPYRGGDPRPAQQGRQQHGDGTPQDQHRRRVQKDEPRQRPSCQGIPGPPVKGTANGPQQPSHHPRDQQRQPSRRGQGRYPRRKQRDVRERFGILSSGGRVTLANLHRGEHHRHEAQPKHGRGDLRQQILRPEATRQCG